MSILITIETKNINDSLIQTVNARDLYTFLEVGKEFANWIFATSIITTDGKRTGTHGCLCRGGERKAITGK